MSDHHDHGDWFRHSEDEALPQQEHAAHVNTTAIGLTLLAIVFGVLFTVVILSMYFVSYANTRKAAMNEGTASAQAYTAYRDQSAATLSTGGWADRAAGTVNLPLDDAMESVIAEYNRPGTQADTEWQGPTNAASAPAQGHQALTDATVDAAGDTISEPEEHTPADG